MIPPSPWAACAKSGGSFSEYFFHNIQHIVILLKDSRVYALLYAEGAPRE